MTSLSLPLPPAHESRTEVFLPPFTLDCTAFFFCCSLTLGVKVVALAKISGCLPDVALALLFAVVKKGDSYLFSPPRRVQWWGSLVEQRLPASSLNRNNRNNRRKKYRMAPSTFPSILPETGSVCPTSHRAPTPLHERGCAAL